MVAMGAFVSLTDLANSSQGQVVNAVGNHLIELAEGLVIERIGDWAPWTPAAEFATPRSIALTAALRPLRNPRGVKRKATDAVLDEFNPERLGVYLEEAEKDELSKWLTARNEASGTVEAAPVGNFPEPLDYPDPARRARCTGSALTDYGYY